MSVGPAAALAGEVVTVESLAAGGEGVAHLSDGMAVFVSRSAPGDTVRLRDVRRRRRHATARVAEVLSPGPGRVESVCPHFAGDRCGGCQWQHLDPGVQAAAKSRIVGDALRRIGGLDVPDPPLVASPRQLGYRSTITLTVRWTGRRPVVGFHDGEDGSRVFALDRCHIARDEVHRLWRAIQPALAALPSGDDVRLKLRVAADGSLHLLAEGGERAWTGHQALQRALDVAGLSATIWWRPGRGAVRRMAGPEADPASVAFEQVNPEVASLLRLAVLEHAVEGPPFPEHRRARVLDLYAGAGEVALALAARGREVTMVELDARAARRASAAARNRGLSLRVLAGRVEQHLDSCLPADVIVANPPRSGLAPEAASALAARPPARLLYVSCDPATLARDLKRMGVVASQLGLFLAYDMFPQTSHVETLVSVDRPVP